MSTAGAAAPPAPRRKVIIDTDAGCDDAVAILMALRDPSVDVVAFTTVFGNVPQAQATENVYTILRVFDRLDIPFYAGASQPLVVDLKIETWPGHGANGLGDASFHEGGEMHDHASYMQRVRAAVGKEHAVEAMIRLTKQHPGEIDLIALGPLTNLALGVRMDPAFASRFRSLTLMGGSSYGKGNASLAGEFNFYCDPEGAYVALQHFPAPDRPVVILPWETTESNALSWTQFDDLTAGHEDHLHGDATTRHLLEASFLKKTHAKYELVARAGHREALAAKERERKNANNQAPKPKRTKSNSGAAVGSTVTADQASAFDELPSISELSAAASSSTAVGSSTSVLAVGVQSYVDEHPAEYVCCDSYAVAAYLRPDLITASATHYAEVIIQGTNDTRGMLAIDWYDKKKGDAAKKRVQVVQVVTGVNKAMYLQMMHDIFQPHVSKTNETKPGGRKRNH